MLVATYFHPGDLSGSDWLLILIVVGLVGLAGLAAVLVPFFLIMRWLFQRHARPAEADASVRQDTEESL
jgi:hypothetical protein